MELEANEQAVHLVDRRCHGHLQHGGFKAFKVEIFVKGTEKEKVKEGGGRRRMGEGG